MSPVGGLVGLAGIVTAARTNLHAAKSLRLSLPMYGPVTALRLWLEGLVADGVLGPDIMRNVLRDLIDFVEVAREERHATGSLRKSAQSTLVTLFARLIVAEDTNG